jgi:hypothetical protein
MEVKVREGVKKKEGVQTGLNVESKGQGDKEGKDAV